MDNAIAPRSHPTCGNAAILLLPPTSPSSPDRGAQPEMAALSIRTRPVRVPGTVSFEPWPSLGSVAAQTWGRRHRATLRTTTGRRIRRRPRLVVPDDVPDERAENQRPEYEQHHHHLKYLIHAYLHSVQQHRSNCRAGLASSDTRPALSISNKKLWILQVFLAITENLETCGL